MERDRLKSSIWIQSQIRICSINNLSAYVIKKGDQDAGVIFIQINKLNGKNDIYYQTRTITGQISWSKVKNDKSFTQKEACDYLEKQNKHSSLKWNRRWFTVQYLEDKHDNDTKVQIAWHKNHNADVLNSIPMIVVDRAWCKLQPGCYVDPQGVIKLPNQVPASIRAQISDDDIKKGKTKFRKFFCKNFIEDDAFFVCFNNRTF